jgi:hypothetical protein
MKFLCLAYGDERGWKNLTTEQQESLLKQDEVLRNRGALIAAVEAPWSPLLPGKRPHWSLKGHLRR